MNKRATVIGFVIAVLIQVMILAAVPARKLRTLATGRSVTLTVQPVDPYSILSGYYVMLSYDISRIGAFSNGNDFNFEGGCYAVIEQGEDGVWRPVSLEHELPQNLPENRVALAGKLRSGRIVYGIEALYIPESKRTAVAEDLLNNLAKARVEIKVDGSGNSALERLTVEDRIYK